MRNQYGGDCYRCGLWVAPGTGYFEKLRDARGWRVQHCYRTHNCGVTCEQARAKDGKAPVPEASAERSGANQAGKEESNG